ncbi:molybdenum cofactor guanylyltransferase [Aquimarina agarilytica]|uniref:molybdenum cofactor guanylyltransferase n=1 Tax=Aquimarina agarilytica TaxID=1087449 RepID=UPI000288C60A|nr:molybdenum cofactor guanylyltransferase [Aquimarina agarilytica]
MDSTIYILCGGKSTRMMTDKALSIYKGETFLSRIIKAVDYLESSIVLVSSNPKHTNLNTGCIPDIINNKGPVSGIITALKNTVTDTNIILSCDLPLIKKDLINWLLNQHKADYDGTVITCNGKQMPLIAIYNKNSLPVFERHLINEQLKLMNVLKELHINFVEIPENLAYQTANINTPKQLKELSL